MKVVENHSQAVCSTFPPLRGRGDIPRCDGNVDFERLYKMYSRRVYALCFRLSRNTEEAEDLTQEAFLQVFRKIDTFRGESAFATWLYRLVLNVALMRLRKKRPPENPLELDANSNHESGTPLHRYGVPDAALTGAIDRVQLERAIAGLPPGYKVVFLLHDVEGYDHHEIAEILGWAQGTSKSQLHKARLKLRDLLGGVTRREVIANGVSSYQNRARVGVGRRSAPQDVALGLRMQGWSYTPCRRKRVRPSRAVVVQRSEPARLLPGTGQRPPVGVNIESSSAPFIQDSTMKVRLADAAPSSVNDIHASQAIL